MRTLAAGLAAVTLLGGCAQLREITESITREPARESARDPAPVESALSAGDRALAYYARLRRLPAAELTRERIDRWQTIAIVERAACDATLDLLRDRRRDLRDRRPLR